MSQAVTSRSTYACSRCSAGWESEVDYGYIPDCRWCGENDKVSVRETYKVVKL